MALNAVQLGETFFIRGDSNEDGRTDISDAVRILTYLFASASPPACLDRLDSNDDGLLDVADAVRLLTFLFAQGESPPLPYPDEGPDPTDDTLNCGPSL